MTSPSEASFLRRPAHTEAEDWIVYHPEMTPTGLMLYLRLRGAVMDPSSSAEDWKKAVRFTNEQMRRLLPRTKQTGKSGPADDPYASERTVRMTLALLVRIGALRRIETKPNKPPVYDFPMYPPDGYGGPTWGGTVAAELRKLDKSAGQTKEVTDRDDPPGNVLPGTEGGGNALPGNEGEAAIGCRVGGNVLPGGEAVTCADGAPKKVFRKNLSLKEGGAGAPEEREESPTAPAGSGTRPRQLTVREAAQDAASALKGISGGATRAEVEKGLQRAIQRGLPPSRAVDWLNGLITPQVRSAHRVHLSNVGDLPDPEPDDAYRWTIEMCTGCDHMGVAKDPAYTSGKNGSVVCLHGREPEPEPPAHRQCSSCGRKLLPRSMDPCGRCRRTEG